ncbi:MAG: hypothetical protein LBQ81_06510 [Zoogloeaceae bacterium]|jgi:hypothetical protein|nr:hypothetical protein [Zoogloeaceae bacterium]
MSLPRENSVVLRIARQPAFSAHGHNPANQQDRVAGRAFRHDVFAVISISGPQ